MLRKYRKPLIVAGPKALLRLPEATSRLDELSSGHRFLPVIDDPLLQDPKKVQKVCLLSGKVYYDLVSARKKKELEQDIALIR